MMYTGIDKHKDNSFLTTVNDEGAIVKQERVRNTQFAFAEYFKPLVDDSHRAVVESTSGWYWLDDFLHELGIPLVLAHAKYLKAISYAKVKTDKIDSETLAQLLRMNYIPEAHKISPELRPVRDLTRSRLRLVRKRTACYNSLHSLAEKWNVSEYPLPDSEQLPAVPALYHEQVAIHTQQINLFNTQIAHFERLLRKQLLYNDDIQRLLWVPGIGSITAFSIYLEIDGIDRFDDPGKFCSYARLVPGANDSNRKHRHKSGNKDGNKYLKIAFTDAAVRAVQFYPEFRAFYRRLCRRRNSAIAHTVVAKELARIVYYILKEKTVYKGFKGQPIQRPKSLTWPRRAAFAPTAEPANSEQRDSFTS